MGDAAVDFGKQFHNLEGNSISDRKKNFFKLLRNKSLFSNEVQLNTALNNLEPKTYLESLLQVDMLIYFKKTEELRRILKEGNEQFISKIIKQPWFFKEAFKNMNAEEFVNEFLPCTSFVTRTKVLKRVSITLSEAQMDEVFECVLKRYGLQIALNILHSCSSKKITEVLSSDEIYLRPNQIKILLDKDQKLFKLYLECYKNTKGRPYDDEKVFKYIAIKNPNLLLELNKEEKLRMHPLGHRTSEKVVDHVKSDITQNIKLYASILKHDVIVRKLGDNFKDVYLDLFPRKMGDMDINSLGNKLLRFYPKSKQWSLFALTFSKVFDDQSVMDNLNHLDSSLIELCPQKEVKQKWAEIKYYSENDDRFLKYFDPSKAIPMIKEKINVTSKVYERLDLIKLMLDTCAQNKDLNSLEKVLEYFCFRHRNEEVSVRKTFLNRLCLINNNNNNNNIKIEDLSQNHWKYINEQIEILRINKEYNHYFCSIFNTKYLEYLFKNGKPFQEEILQYAKEIISEISSFLPKIKNPAIEKQIFIQIVNIIPEVVTEENYNVVYRQLILDVVCFNETNINSDHCMSLLDFPILVTFINTILDKIVDYNESQLIKRVIEYNYQFPQNAVNIDNAKLVKIIVTNLAEEFFYFMDLIKYMVMRKNRSELDNEILQLYFDKVFDRHTSDKISYWFLNNEPLTIVPYFDKISRTMFFKEIKLYSHLNFDVKLIVYLKTQLSKPNDPDDWDKEKIVRFLPVLLPTNDFIDIVVEHFLPKIEKLDLQDEEIKTIYNIQCEVAKILKDVVEPGKMLPTVMKFCAGDYLQSALRSLYSICYRSPENQLHLYMDILSKKSVSVRKHALFLSCKLLEYKYVVNQLKTAKQDNASSQKHVYSATLKYFLKNPSQELFDMVISNMNRIDKNDTETLDKLSSIVFPKKYRAVFIEKCWEFFENMRKHKEVKVTRYLRSLLLAILNSSDILVALPSEFCKNIINFYFKDQKDDLLNIELFVCNVLRYREMEQAENFRFVFEIIQLFKVDNGREFVKQFFDKFYAVVTEDINSNFLKLFTEYWERLFTPVEMFDEYILLKLLNIQCEAGEPFIENYAKAVVVLLEELNAEYSLHVHNKFKNQLAKALDSTFEKKKDKYLFFHNVLKFKTSITTSILVLDLISKVEEDNLKEVSDIFYDIMKILKDVEDPIVKIYYRSYLS